MKSRILIFILLLTGITAFFSCKKQEYFKSESEIKKELQGTWTLIPIPRYDTLYNPDHSYTTNVHNETWTFSDNNVTIVNSGQTGTSTFSVNTTMTKAEFKLDGVTPAFSLPARVRNINGTWQIVLLDNNVLVIANDQDGASGLTELEFQK